MHALERLAMNPHYKMNDEQLAELTKLRGQNIVRHNPAILKHDTQVPKHKINLEMEDGTARRDTPQQSSDKEKE